MSLLVQPVESVKEHDVESLVEVQQRVFPLCPSLYQINTRVLMQELIRKLGRPATLDDIPDEDLDNLAQLGFDWIWFLGVWQTGAVGVRVSRENQIWAQEFREFLPDLQETDVCGSCFAVVKYETHRDFGGNLALDRLRDRVHARGMKLLLDFVPNHTALDHEWVAEHPEFYIHGSEDELRSQPQNYVRIGSGHSSSVFAYGRDPYFDGWPDTAQLNYAEPKLQQAMINELKQISVHCDGVRCDMAMLILPEVFERTWGRRPESFWNRAIQSVRESRPGFLFMAEVYWDLEWHLQQLGFSYTYDKRLYDRLREGHPRPIRDHFCADMDYQMKSVRFLENHDEPRAAAVFPPEKHRAAAVLTFLCPGLRFFHEGQLQGRKKKVPVHLNRRPDEQVDSALLEFYERLLACVTLPEVRNGAWSLLDCTAAWEGNWTADGFIGFGWSDSQGHELVVAVNFSPNQGQCYLHLPFRDLAGRLVLLEDLMSPAKYERNGTELSRQGLYLDLSAWAYHVFRLKPLAHV